MSDSWEILEELVGRTLLLAKAHSSVGVQNYGRPAMILPASLMQCLWVLSEWVGWWDVNRRCLSHRERCSVDIVLPRLLSTVQSNL